MLRRINIAVLFLLGVALATPDASAQRRYQPAYGPTITPYLQYLNPNPGPTNAYYSYIQPRRQMQQTLRQIQSSFQQNQAGLNAVNTQLMRRPQMPTGSATTYLNFSHYYGGFNGGAGFSQGGGRAFGQSGARVSVHSASNSFRNGQSRISGATGFRQNRNSGFRQNR
jgi:hypothetical protein